MNYLNIYIEVGAGVERMNSKNGLQVLKVLIGKKRIHGWKRNKMEEAALGTLCLLTPGLMVYPYLTLHIF